MAASNSVTNPLGLGGTAGGKTTPVKSNNGAPQNPTQFHNLFHPALGWDPEPSDQTGPKGGIVQGIRSTLYAHGFNVSKTGPQTPHLMKAYASFMKGGSTPQAITHWNNNNPIEHPSFTPSTAPGVVNRPQSVAPAKTTVGNGVSDTTAPPSTAPPPSNLTSGYTPAQIQALVAQYSKQFAVNNKVPSIPNIDPTVYANAQAAMQYGPVIAQLQQQENEATGAEPIAQQNISQYYAPVQATAAQGTQTDDAVNQALTQASQGQGANIAASLGLSGAAAGGLNAQGATQSSLDQALAGIMHQQDTASQTAQQGVEAQAHTTEASDNTNTVANLRQQLLAQIAAKGSATVADKTAAEQQNYANQNTNFANNTSLQNQKVTGALAARQLVGTDQGLQTTAQNQGVTAETEPYKIQAAQDAHNQSLNSQQLTQAQTWAVQHPTTKTSTADAAKPFSAIDPGTRENLTQYLRTTNRTANPSQAYNNILGVLQDRYGFKGPQVQAFAKNIVDTYWAKNNPNWGWNVNKQTYTKK